MDVQRGIVGGVDDARNLLDHLRRVTGTARRAGITVVYVMVTFREGYPEVSPRNRSFSAIAGTGRFTESAADTEIASEIAPQAGDIVVTKRRVSAFSGSDLDMVLRAHDIHTLVLAGIATSGVVLSTVRAAADRDYRLIVLSDCCADADPEVQHVLMTKVFPRQAEVLSSDEWVASLAKQR